ncbi:MAG: discoidin domain-containing protein [Candidatus Sumerlaeaceae bacterium]
MRGFHIVITSVIVGTASIVTAQTTETATQVPAAAASGSLKPLEIKLPKPVFVGTPKNIKVENLEVGGKSRDAFLAPADAVNLALKKEVTSSDNEPVIGELEQITDGNKEAADGNYVELGPGRQWVQIDLGQVCEISAVVIWHFHQQARVYHDVVVQSADDPDFIKNVQTIFNNDHDNTAQLGIGKDKAYVETNEGRLIDAKGVKGRYIRLVSKGNTSNEMNHYIEVEVYGRAAK